MTGRQRAGVRVAALSLMIAGALRLAGEQPAAPSAREDAYRANNVGVAMLEQFNYDEAAGSFKKALSIDGGLEIARLNLAIALLYAGKPEEASSAARVVAERQPDLPQAHYVIGLAARAQGSTADARAAFERVLRIDPSDAGSRINIAQIQIQQRQFPEAIALLREAIAAEPYNVTGAYALALALTRSGAAEEGRAAMQRFESLRDSGYGVTYSQTYLEQGRYGEAMASTGAEPGLVDPATPPVTFVDASASLPASARTRPRASYMTTDFPPLSGSITLADFEGDGDLDLYAMDIFGQRFYANEPAGSSRALVDVTAARGLATDGSVAAAAAIVGDYNNDRRLDILTLRPQGHRLWYQDENGRFREPPGNRALPVTGSLTQAGASVDLDHDGDLDIFLAGDNRTPSAGDEPLGRSDRVLRNNGDGTFTEITGASGIGGTPARGLAVAPTDFDNRRDIDVLVLVADGPPRLFKNMRDGTFRDVSAEAGLPGAGTYASLAAGDVNKDGFTDFWFGRVDAPGLLALSNGRGRFEVGEGPPAVAPRAVRPLKEFQPVPRQIAQFVDYDNDGLLDLFTAAGTKVQLFRNLGRKWADVTEAAGLAALGAAAKGGDFNAAAFGDVDRDGDLDAVLLLTSGHLHYWRNDGGSTNRSLLVHLTGRVSNRFGAGSKIELRAGSLRQRLETSAATPAIAPADALFGLGRRTAADVVRVQWPSGTLQAETLNDLRTLAVTELDRKPSSCPYLYTWNGTRFEFLTDFMGGGEIGYWQGPGQWNTPDPDEYVRIPQGQLLPRDGRYELRVTNELEEALFVDRLQLIAVDHAAGVEVFPNEGLGAPAAAAFATTVRNARPPAAARDEHGHDVLSRVSALDRQYPDDFELLSIRGYAAPHELRLDLGPEAADAILLATGWTDYAFSSDNVAAHHRGLSLAPPALDVKSPEGVWRRVLPNIGIPVGRPQTVVLDLRGRLEPGEREIRIVTNMRIYWDRMLVASPAAAPMTTTRIDPAIAELRWRGFSAEVSPDGREPYAYDYDRVGRESPWKTPIGRYTREGDVRPLLTAVDDMFAIARPGDEVALSFAASDLPPLGPGMTRTFLLYADGFSKEMDIGSASPHGVLPLPFHGMQRYPYGAGERYPDTAAHREYQERYNTRVVTRPTPPLETSAGGRPAKAGLHE